MLVRKIDCDFKFENEVGSLVQLVHDGWKQVNVLKSLKNSERGGHFHKVNEELFYIIDGKLRLNVEYNMQKEELTFEAGDMFVLLPFQKHSFKFLENTTMVSMYSNGVEMEDGTKDIYVK